MPENVNQSPSRGRKKCIECIFSNFLPAENIFQLNFSAKMTSDILPPNPGMLQRTLDILCPCRAEAKIITPYSGLESEYSFEHIQHSFESTNCRERLYMAEKLVSKLSIISLKNLKRKKKRKCFFTRCLIKLRNSLPQDLMVVTGLDGFKKESVKFMKVRSINHYSHDGWMVPLYEYQFLGGKMEEERLPSCLLM